MEKILTHGRWPTVEEVLEYYSRPEILAYLLDTARTRRVAFVFEKTLHWEPDWRGKLVRASNEDELRRYIEERVLARIGNRSRKERMAFYPSFHMHLFRTDPPWSEDVLDQICRDYVYEADLPSWRECFEDVLPMLKLLDEFEIQYKLKFSGSRSLHLMIPGENFMGDEKPSWNRIDRRMKRMLKACGSKSHPAHLSRVPYSLNEDTGLVSIPIRREDLHAFRPWQASMHAVKEIDRYWLEPTRIRKASALLQAAQRGGSQEIRKLRLTMT